MRIQLLPVLLVLLAAVITLASEPYQIREKDWEPVPAATYTASQTPGEVIIRARGDAPSAGYEVKFVQSMLRIYPPQHQLVWKKPQGPAAQVVTPFEVITSFKASEPVAKVIVIDGAGKHEITVDQARD